jgi:myo-inositol-hexaphosphate 3-phosphohydrolase
LLARDSAGRTLQDCRQCADLASGSFGKRYPAGLFIAQVGQNAPAAHNFKRVP